MSTSATSRTRTAERIPPWSSISRGGARPHRCPASHSTPHSTLRTIILAAEATSIGPTNRRNHPSLTPPRLALNPIAAIKSP
jgi:hypothetical protein